MRRIVKSKLRGRKALPVIGQLQAVMARPAMFYGGILVALLFLSLLHIQQAQSLRSKTWSAISPVVSAISAPFIAVTSFVGDISSYQKLQADYQLLKAENERLMQWYHTAQLLQAENQSLKSLLNVQSMPERSFVTARVMSDISSPYVRSILLDVGEADGVSVGQAVIADQGLLGRIVDVEDSISRVLLLTDINSRVPVMIEGTSQRAVIAGRNLDLPRLEYISEEVALEKGMSIVTSGDGDVLPVGLPIGKILSVQNGAIQVGLLVRHQDVDFVRVLEQVKP